MPTGPSSRRSSRGTNSRKPVRLGQRYQDLDPRRPHRVGTIVSVERARVKIRWDASGHTTTVKRSHLAGSGSRGYILIGEKKSPPPPDVKPTTVADCRSGRARDGRRRYRCFGCGRLGTLRPPWRVLLWTHEKPTRSTVVCGTACHAIARQRAR